MRLYIKPYAERPISEASSKSSENGVSDSKKRPRGNELQKNARYFRYFKTMRLLQTRFFRRQGRLYRSSPLWLIRGGRKAYSVFLQCIRGTKDGPFAGAAYCRIRAGLRPRAYKGRHSVRLYAHISKHYRKGTTGVGTGIRKQFQ